MMTTEKKTIMKEAMLMVATEHLLKKMDNEAKEELKKDLLFLSKGFSDNFIKYYDVMSKISERVEPFHYQVCMGLIRHDFEQARLTSKG